MKYRTYIQHALKHRIIVWYQPPSKLFSAQEAPFGVFGWRWVIEVQIWRGTHKSTEYIKHYPVCGIFTYWDPRSRTYFSNEKRVRMSKRRDVSILFDERYELGSFKISMYVGQQQRGQFCGRQKVITMITPSFLRSLRTVSK